ncbi:MAG: polysaccharide biosynthesis/export family protein [Paludibacteraceae bacterium]|nr:polysaccharide biosynthesis/export family protein [Paludibacteraceae bacterium]
MKKTLKLLVIAICAVLLSSCKTQEKILYFQDIQLNKSEPVVGSRDIRLQPKDQISIIVNSKDPQLAALFNLATSSNQVGSAGSGDRSKISGYTLDDKGEIDFPVLGKVKISGMTKSEVAEHIKTSLMEANLINDPVVTVEFMNLYVTVLGEVGRPGKYMITKDQITLLEALSMAGDLSIYGIRDGIYVVREENGQRITYKTDIRSKNMFASPAYFLKQNDVIYVEPNKTKTKNSRIGNATGIVFSAVGVLFSAINIVITIINNSK